MSGMKRFSLHGLASGQGCLRHRERSLSGMAVEALFETLSRLGRLHPQANPRRHGVRVTRDVPYASDGAAEHLLDVYVPTRVAEPRPAVLYVHGGGFRILSKETHWVFGLTFAAGGYVAFVMNYRLAPVHRFPAALQDVCEAWMWLLDNAAAFGADPSRVVVAGESAGANLAVSLTLAATVARPEPFARQVFERGTVPRAVWCACGLLQVTDPERLWRQRPIGAFFRDRIVTVCDGYLPVPRPEADRLLLADPLVLLESETPAERPLPPFFVSAGTADPIVDDTRRLEAALCRRKVPYEARYDPGQPHAYQAMLWKRSARALWRDTFRFLGKHV
jgi:acetyl esterase